MLRAALVGCGPRGHEHARALQQTAGVQLAGLCDREPAVLAPAIRTLGVPGYSTLAEVCKRTHPHIVVIATPPQHRLTLVQHAADFPGVRAIVIEKPMALSLADAHAMMETCAARGILCLVGHQLRHAPEFVALKQAIEAGEIGSLQFLRGVCYGNLLNQGIHLIDLMRWLNNGRPIRWVMSQRCDDAELLSQFDEGQQPFGADPAHPAPAWMTHHLVFEGGLRASLETGAFYDRSRSFHGDWLQKRITAIGSDGMAESQAASHCRVLSAGHAWRTQSFNLDDYQHGTRLFYDELVQAIHGNGVHRNEARDALHSLEAVFACLQSAERGSICTLPLDRVARLESVKNVDSAAQPSKTQGVPPAALYFSIILPLPDHRGLALQCVESFANSQTYPRDRYELVMLSDGTDPDLDEQVRARLGPADQFIVHATDNETLLYDMGARAARGRMILFSELHCIAEPQCLTALAEYLATHMVDGACLRSVGIVPNWMARLEERQYNQGFAEFGRPGDWRKVILRGIAIDRDAYLASGGFEHAFGRFSEWALAAKLHSQGRRLGYASGAAVQHLYTTHMHQLMPHVLNFSAEEILYRDHQPAEYCDRYFGIPAEWQNRHHGNREAARVLGRAIGRRFWRLGEWADKGRLLRMRLRQRLTQWLGWRPRRWGAQMALRWAMLRCWLRRDDASYRLMYQHMARLGRAQGLATRTQTIPPAITQTGVYPISALPDDALVGFHAPETFQGDIFRWTRSVAALPLALPAGNYEITLDTRGLDRAETWRTLQVTLDGRSLPCEIDEGLQRLRMRFTIQPHQAHQKAWLAFTCRPLRPWKQGRPDARELGVPIFSVNVESLDLPAIVFAARVPSAFAARNREASPAHLTAIQTSK